MTLREELEKLADNYELVEGKKAKVSKALTAIEKLIEERYVEKEKEGMYDCLDENCSTLKKKNALIKSAVLTIADYQKNYITLKEAYEKAVEGVLTLCNDHEIGNVRWLRGIMGTPEELFEALRNAFGIQEPQTKECDHKFEEVGDEDWGSIKYCPKCFTSVKVVKEKL